MRAFFDEMGAAAGIFVVMLYIAAAMDGALMFSVAVRKIADIKEYAAAVLKWQKIALLYAAAAVVLWYLIFGGYSPYITVILAVLCVLLLADGVLSTVIKKKFGAKK